jgi:hypothetical protein
MTTITIKPNDYIVHKSDYTGPHLTAGTYPILKQLASFHKTGSLACQMCGESVNQESPYEGCRHGFSFACVPTSVTIKYQLNETTNLDCHYSYQDSYISPSTNSSDAPQDHHCVLHVSPLNKQ